MIDRFKDWIGKKKNINEPELVYDKNEFKEESENLLSYLMDKIEIVVESTSSNWLVVELIVKQDKSEFSDLDRMINGYKIVSFKDVKDDLIQYFNYINRKYILNKNITIINEDTFDVSSYDISELNSISDLEFTSIKFYIN